MRAVYLGIIVPASIVLPIGIAIMRYTRLSAATRIIFVYLCIAAIVNTVAIILSSRWINNMPLLHLFTVIEFLVLAAFYRRLLKGSVRSFISGMFVLFPLACIANAVFLQSIYYTNTVTRSLEAIIITCLGVLFLFQQLGAEEIDKPAEPVHWMNAGLLLYFSGSFFLFLFSEVLGRHRSVDNAAWVIHATLVLVMYVLFAIGFFRIKKA